MAQQKRIHLTMQEIQETRVQSLGQEDPLERVCMDRGVHRVANSGTQLKLLSMHMTEGTHACKDMQLPDITELWLRVKKS